MKQIRKEIPHRRHRTPEDTPETQIGAVEAMEQNNALESEARRRKLINKTNENIELIDFLLAQTLEPVAI